ncbi:MAG: hypothetical protein JNM56_21210 [Planctomycetia bacterium]|nr:hypothetical protein [Planctomycetia bacterium]
MRPLPAGLCQCGDWSRRLLGLLGVVSLLACAGLLVLSFEFQSEASDPPLPRALVLLGLATLCWLTALGVLFGGANHPDGSRLTLILVFAVFFRLLLLPSWPIQEIDFYRYLWDGRVTLDGGNPFRYSPWAVLETGPYAPPSSEVHGIWQLANQSDSIRTILERVHYPQIPTAYPPVAQAVFALSAAITPADAPVYVHVLLWKAVLLVFDAGTVVVLVLLLRRLQLPASWCLAYAWCPLVLKEFANSGHFDAIAVFFSTLALYALAGLKTATAVDRAPLRRAVWGCVALGLAILAKSYPVVLLPVVAAYLIARIGRRAVLPLGAAVAIVLLGYAPFVGGTSAPPPSAASVLLDIPEPSNPGSGLAAFLSQWEVNDFLFMLVKENLRAPSAADPWFTVMPAVWRQALHDAVLIPLASAVGLPVQAGLALLATQCLLGLVLLVLALRWAAQVYRQPEPVLLLRAAFLTLAWAWLLSGAQNPWYLVWCLPFVVFDGRKSWFLLPGLVLLYYVGFWLERQPDAGAFESALVWVEFLPFLLLLAWETRRARPSHDETEVFVPSTLPTVARMVAPVSRVEVAPEMESIR